jgi:hypothetical protein
MGWTAEESTFDSRKGQKTAFHTVQTDSGAHPANGWYPQGAVTPEVKRQGLEADHLPPSSAEVKNVAAIPPLPHIS